MLISGNGSVAPQPHILNEYIPAEKDLGRYQAVSIHYQSRFWWYDNQILRWIPYELHKQVISIDL